MSKSYRNMAFLSELIVNILVFCISCAILAGLFGKAGMVAKRVKEEGFAYAEAHALLETASLRGLNGVAQAAEKTADNEVRCYYDKNWETAPKQEAVYVAMLRINATKNKAGQLQQLFVRVSHLGAETVICELETANYLPFEGGEAA